MPCSDMALRLDPAVQDSLPYHLMMLDEVLRRVATFDVLHFHIDLLPYPFLRPFADRVVTTLHGRLDLPDLKPFYTSFPDLPLVSISDAQRTPMPPVNWAGTIYHGLPADLLPFVPAPKDDYLAFLGRISPEKRPDRAIEIAARAGRKLKIAAKVDRVDQQYFDECIAPLIAAHPNVEFIGEINDGQKAAFLGNAAALLFPIDWPEPFGLAMIEAMSCGTPVIAFGCGSVPEVVDHGASGFIVHDLEQGVDAIGRLGELDRGRVRATFEQRFTAERMAKDYVALYRRLPGVGRKDAYHSANGHSTLGRNSELQMSDG